MKDKLTPLTEGLPTVEEVGEKVLIWRALGQTQSREAYAIHATVMLRFCEPTEVWWMQLPDAPIQEQTNKIDI